MLTRFRETIESARLSRPRLLQCGRRSEPLSIRVRVEGATFQRGGEPHRIRSNLQLTFQLQFYNCFMLIVSCVSWSNVVTTRAFAW